jgi:hypothetical protein
MIRNTKEFLILTGWLALAAISGCTDRPKEQAKRTFPAVTVPSVYANSAERAEFLTTHYWDRFDFADTAYLGSAVQVTEQALVDYITILPYASYPVIAGSLKQLMNSAEQSEPMYAFFSSKLEQYLFDLNSPLRNDEFFIPVLEQMINSETLIEQRKARPKLLLPQLQKNRPGTKAANLRYTTLSGARTSLHDLKADFILILFHNLDCGNCKELTAQIEASPVILEMQKQKRLTVLAFYPGQDAEAWKKHASESPSTWTNGYDREGEIYGQELYALRIIPTLYLLDRNHHIIMKDAPLNFVHAYLNSILTAQNQTGK